ncbi:uracil-DNA glycosylase [Streptococcus rupicaprae]|uniref:Uracil-DNA glycosylase n=2 Tax=Streptococcus rupicaprae TaxID=759619 RepID=A0ABV2FHX4_9STRE
MINQDMLKKEIMADPANRSYTDLGITPLFEAPETAKILIIGQAPGQKTQEAGVCFKDRSGDRLRNWLGVDEGTFYRSGHFGILPMDFYFPGKGTSGDLPPRPDFAAKWHPKLLALMPQVELICLVGIYAQKAYLDLPLKASLTQTVQAYQAFGPLYFPLVHPSPRNQIWMAKNPWFETDVLPALKERVKKILSTCPSL